MAKKVVEFNYGTRAAELEAVLEQLQDPNIELDTATKLHAKGLQLISEIEAYLKQAENEVRKHAAE